MTKFTPEDLFDALIDGHDEIASLTSKQIEKRKRKGNRKKKHRSSSESKVTKPKNASTTELERHSKPDFRFDQGSSMPVPVLPVAQLFATGLQHRHQVEFATGHSSRKPNKERSKGGLMAARQAQAKAKGAQENELYSEPVSRFDLGSGVPTVQAAVSDDVRERDFNRANDHQGDMGGRQPGIAATDTEEVVAGFGDADAEENDEERRDRMVIEAWQKTQLRRASQARQVSVRPVRPVLSHGDDPSTGGPTAAAVTWGFGPGSDEDDGASSFGGETTESDSDPSVAAVASTASTYGFDQPTREQSTASTYGFDAADFDTDSD